MSARRARIEREGSFQVRRGLRQAIQREFDTAQFQVCAGGVGMTLQDAFQRRHGIFGLSLAKQEYAVVDSRIFVRRGAAMEAHRLAEGIAGLGGLAERFERKRQQPVGFAVFRVPLQRTDATHRSPAESDSADRACGHSRGRHRAARAGVHKRFETEFRRARIRRATHRPRPALSRPARTPGRSATAR